MFRRLRLRRGGEDSCALAGPAAKLNLKNSRLALGTAQSGGAVYASDASRVTVRGSLFSENIGFARGGAIAVDGSAEVVVRTSDFRRNAALSETREVAGGAISHAATSGAVSISDSTFTENRAVASGMGNYTLGGAIQAAGALTIRSSTFEANEVFAQQGNAVEYGGAILVGGGSTEIANSTFADNDALDSNGAGGAIYADAGTATLVHVTLIGNLANSGDSFAAGDLGSVGFSGSVIDSDLFAGSVCEGPVGSGGFNVVEGTDDDCAFVASDATAVGGAGIGVFALAANGGPTQTFALKKSSEAVNFVPTPKCVDVTKRQDQRGYARPKGMECDAGSFERGAKKP